MRLRAYILWAPVAMGVGLLVLIGYFLPSEINPLAAIRATLLQWAVWLAAAALLIGLVNLLSVHWSKISLLEPGWPYSAILILFFLTTLVLGLVFGPDYPLVMLLFQYIQLPVEASLMALLSVTLVLAGFRLLGRRRSAASLVFLAVAMLVLIGTAPWPVGAGGGLQEMFVVGKRWLTQVFAGGGARGILLGVALGSITTGLRVLLAADRPYGN
jgi:hypothetical protein